MWAIEFGEPEGGSRTWKLLERIQPGLFAQLVVVPLFRDHRILSQVAGHGLNVIKALPPLVVDEDDLDWFVDGARRDGRPRREDAPRARPLRPAGRPRRADAAQATGSRVDTPHVRDRREAQMTIDLRVVRAALLLAAAILFLSGPAWASSTSARP